MLRSLYHPSFSELYCDLLNENPLGTCGCHQQIFVSPDCSEAFYCSQYAAENMEGCHLKCPEGQIVETNLYNRTWECK